MLSLQTFYPRISLGALSFQVRPSGFFGNWTQTSGLQQTYAKYAGALPGTTQQGAAPLGFASIAAGSAQNLGCVQFLFDPLAGGTFAAGLWGIGFGARLSNAGATYLWTPRAALYVVNGQTGARRATVFDVQAIGATARTTTAERTAFATLISGAAFTCFPGDYFVLELGLGVNNTGAGAVVPQADILADGGTAIGADNVATTDAQAALYAPYAFTLSLPQAGEPPVASVSYAEAVRLTRDAWPPGTFHAFDDPTSPDAGLLNWLAQVLKAYGWDLLDLLLRELNPLQAQAKLYDWRSLLNIPQNPPLLEALRAIVLARLRESGPSSLFNIAAAAGTALGYADPSALEILEISATAMRTALTVTTTVGSAIPADFAFGSSNLVSRTGFNTDGGAVWGPGAVVRLQLDQAAGPLLYAQLESPDGFKVSWAPISRWDPQDLVTLYAPAMSGHAVHGNWTLRLYCDPASPAVTLQNWTLYAPGAPRWPTGVYPPAAGFVPGVVRSGEGRWRMWWGVYADPTKYGARAPADFGAARAALNRIRQASQVADLVLSKTPMPGAATTLPGMFIPG